MEDHENIDESPTGGENQQDNSSPHQHGSSEHDEAGDKSDEQ